MYQSIFAILLVMFVSCSTNKISEEQAIRIAEKFIVQNGYTNSEIKIDTNQIAADFGETQMSKDRILELRYNTLEPHVSFKSKKMGKWTFGFRNSRDSSRYQLVKLSGNGKKIWVVHQDVKVKKIQN